MSMKGFSLKKKDVKKETKAPGSVFGEDESSAGPSKVAVQGFNQSGAISDQIKDSDPKDELVITPQSNKDWREEVRKRVYTPYPQKVEVHEQKLSYGLTVKTKTEPKNEQETSNDNDNDDNDNRNGNNERGGDVDEDNEEELPQLTEAQAFQVDMEARPDAPDLDTYDRIPVEEFGNALLRGMGYTPESDEEDQPVQAKRPTLLGLGAKPVNAPATDELGSWGKGASKRNTAIADKAYIPLVKRNKATGEILHEDDQRKRPRREDDDRERDRSASESRDRYSDRERRERHGDERRSNRRDDHRYDRRDRRNDRRDYRKYDQRNDRSDDRRDDRRDDRKSYSRDRDRHYRDDKRDRRDRRERY
uniref:Pre-mRNA-splicing factor n=1 Tax=Blastobotrys adeninivorans TaxID=409370 RepID=A0A060T287_BLAAD